MKMITDSSPAFWVYGPVLQAGDAACTPENPKLKKQVLYLFQPEGNKKRLLQAAWDLSGQGGKDYGDTIHHR